MDKKDSTDSSRQSSFSSYLEVGTQLPKLQFFLSSWIPKLALKILKILLRQLFPCFYPCSCSLNYVVRFKISVEIMEYNPMCLIIAYIPKKTILYMDLFSVISH